MKNINFLLFVCIFLISCEQSQNTDANKGDKTELEASSNDQGLSEKEKNPPSFIIKAKDNVINAKKSDIYLSIGNQEIHAVTAVECVKIPKEEYANYQIPAEAIDACGGWWAGMGEYFYLIDNKEKNYYQIMGTKLFEEDQNPTYEYNSVMNLTWNFKE